MLQTKDKKGSVQVNLNVHTNGKTTRQITVNRLENIEVEKIAKYIRWQQSNSRSATYATKDVSELAYSTRKLRKQKGGGCARARNKGAVHFRGGATIFGPDERKHNLKMNKKERVLGLQHAMSLKIQENNIIIVEDLKFPTFTVKGFLEFKKQHGMTTNSILLMDVNKSNEVLQSINNIHEAHFLPVIGINVLSLVKSEIFVCTELALKALQERGVL